MKTKHAECFTDFPKSDFICHHIAKFDIIKCVPTCLHRTPRRTWKERGGRWEGSTWSTWSTWRHRTHGPRAGPEAHQKRPQGACGEFLDSNLPLWQWIYFGNVVIFSIFLQENDHWTPSVWRWKGKSNNKKVITGIKATNACVVHQENVPNIIKY